MDFEAVDANYIAGTPYVGANVRMYAGPGGHRGEFIAWDPVQRRKAWAIPERFPVWSGAVVTAGDVVFYGTMDGWLKAVHARTGEALWQFKTGSGIVGQPITSNLFLSRERSFFGDRDRPGIQDSSTVALEQRVRPAQALEVSRIAYQADRVDFLALLDTQRVLLDVELDYYRALSDLEQALADLERAVGAEIRSTMVAARGEGR